MRMLKRASRQVTRWPEHGCGAWFSGDFHVISISPNLNYQQLNNLVICGGQLLAKFKFIYFQNFIFCPISGPLSPRAQVQDFPHRHSLCSLHVSSPLYKIILFFKIIILLCSPHRHVCPPLKDFLCWNIRLSLFQTPLTPHYPRSYKGFPLNAIHLITPIYYSVLSIIPLIPCVTLTTSNFLRFSEILTMSSRTFDPFSQSRL